MKDEWRFYSIESVHTIEMKQGWTDLQKKGMYVLLFLE